MAIAKSLKANPREIAQAVATKVDLAPLADAPEVAGPGFLNVRLRDDWLAATVGDLLVDETLGITPPARPKKIVSQSHIEEARPGNLRWIGERREVDFCRDGLGKLARIRFERFGDGHAAVGLVIPKLGVAARAHRRRERDRIATFRRGGGEGVAQALQDVHGSLVYAFGVGSSQGIVLGVAPDLFEGVACGPRRKTWTTKSP